MIESGRLRERITIQSRTLTADSYGGQTETWATFATVWAEIRALSGREYFQSQQVTADVTHQVTIRYLSGVKAEMRISWGTRTLDIQHAGDPTGNKEAILMICRERVQ